MSASLSWLAVFAGPFVGSFLTTLIERLPAARGIVLDRSRCLACHCSLGALDLIPLLSWLFTRGHCRHCGARISVSYPLIEIAATLVALWAALTLDGWLVWATCGLGWVLLGIAVIDWRHFLISDALSAFVAALGLVTIGLIDAERLPFHLAAAAGGYAAFRLVGFGYARLRQHEGLGHGDAKLIAASGLWVSWQGLPSVVLLACVTAMIVLLARALLGRRLSLTDRIPFGTHLALGTWLVWLYGPIDLFFQ